MSRPSHHSFSVVVSSHILLLIIRGHVAPRRVYGITLTDEFLRKEPSYWERDPEVDVIYWGTAAMFVTERACLAYPCRLEYVETKRGTRPCVVLADTKPRAAVFQVERSEQLKSIQVAIGTDRIPHWYWLT